MAESPHSVKPGSHGTHEQTDADPAGLLKFGGGLLLLIVGVLALMYATLRLMERHPPEATTLPSALADRSALPPEPRLQADPAADLVTFKQWEDSILTSYAWVDRDHQIARVPVDSAIVMVARKGLPLDPAAVREAERESARKKSPQTAPGPDAPSGRSSGQSREMNTR